MGDKNECGCGCPEGAPERKPKECTPEKIEACHGETKEHPCESEKKSCEEKGSCCE